MNIKQVTIALALLCTLNTMAMLHRIGNCQMVRQLNPKLTQVKKDGGQTVLKSARIVASIPLGMAGATVGWASGMILGIGVCAGCEILTAEDPFKTNPFSENSDSWALAGAEIGFLAGGAGASYLIAGLPGVAAVAMTPVALGLYEHMSNNQKKSYTRSIEDQKLMIKS